MNEKTSHTVFDSAEIVLMRMGALLTFLLFALAAASPAFGDTFDPCQTGTLVTITNTRCTIGDKIFTFGTPNFPHEPFEPSAVSFSPDPANTGFILGGNFSVTGTSELAVALAINIPMTVATVNGQPTIIGGTTFFEGGAFEGGAPLPAPSLLPDFEMDATALLCDSNHNCIDLFPIIRSPLTLANCHILPCNDSNGHSVPFTQTLPAPVSFLEGTETLAVRASNGTASFNSATLQVNQAPVPEPSSVLLIATGLLGVLGAARAKLLR